MAAVVHDSANYLERRREMLRRVLVAPPGECPIWVDIDFTAGKGWRRAIKGVAVRHVWIRRGRVDGRGQEKVGLSVVAGAVAAEAGQPEAPAWDLDQGLATWERKLGSESFDLEYELAGCGNSTSGVRMFLGEGGA
jgi:hypothetical protein